MRFAFLAFALIVGLAPAGLNAQDVAEVKRLKARVELLEVKLEAATLKIEKLQAENEKLKSAPAGATTTNLKVDPLAEGTRWKGTFTIANAGIPGTTKGTATVAVVERGDRTAKLSVTYEGGAVWTFNCRTDAAGRSLTVRETERVKVADVNAGKESTLGPVGGTSGTASVRQEKLTLGYTVPNTLEARVTAMKEK